MSAEPRTPRHLFWSTYIDRTASCARMATDGFGAGVRLAWRAVFPLMRPMFRRSLGIDAERVERARRRLGEHFDRLEQEIGPSGYLVGDVFTVADLTAAAVMTAIIRPPEFSYPLPEPRPRELVEIRDGVAGRPGSDGSSTPTPGIGGRRSRSDRPPDPGSDREAVHRSEAAARFGRGPSSGPPLSIRACSCMPLSGYNARSTTRKEGSRACAAIFSR